MTKHTPGPWGWCEGDSGTSEYPPEEPSVGPEDGGSVVCWLNSGEEPSEVWHANAKLIAAAPEILEALTLFVNGCERMYSNPGKESAWFDNPYLAAKAAIAKATA